MFDLLIILAIFYLLIFFFTKDTLKKQIIQLSKKYNLEQMESLESVSLFKIFSNCSVIENYYFYKNDNFSILFIKLENKNIEFTIHAIIKKTEFKNLTLGIFPDETDDRFNKPLFAFKNFITKANNKLMNDLININKGFLLEINRGNIVLGLINRQYNLNEIESYFFHINKIESILNVNCEK